MKRLLLATALVGLTAFNALPQSSTSPAVTRAQPSQADLLKITPELSRQNIESIVRFQTTTMSQILGLTLEIDGVLPRMIRSGNPLQMINPFAPARYGSGFDNVSIDPQTGRANGISFIAIKF